jgi:hypothetical protein
MSSLEHANRGENLVWLGEIERKLAKVIKDYLYLLFFLLIILCSDLWRARTFFSHLVREGTSPISPSSPELRTRLACHQSSSLHKRRDYILVPIIDLSPILHTWFRYSCFTCDSSSTIQVSPLLFNIGMVI